MVTFLSSLLTFGFNTASPLRFWHAVFAFAYGILGLFGNCLLLWLVKRCKHSELAVYSRILVTNSYIDIVFLVISIFARYGENMVVPESAKEFTYGYGVLNWEIFQWTPTIVNYVIAFAWLISLYYSQWSIAIQFLYRYCIVVHGITLTYLQYGICLLLVLLLELPLWGVMVYNSYGRTMQMEFIRNVNQTELLNGSPSTSMGVDPNNGPIGPVRICWYNYNVNSELFQIWSWFHFGYLIVFYIVICFCAISIFWTIHAHLKRAKLGSSVNGLTETSKQITTVLCIQSLLPLFFAYAPTIYLKLTNLFGATPFFASFGLLLGMWNPWLSVMNPIICILCIRRYRNRLQATFLRKQYPSQPRGWRPNQRTTVSTAGGNFNFNANNSHNFAEWPATLNGIVIAPYSTTAF